ncbi:MAG: 2-isopropylmalate synthase [Rhodobiaceae bacterium]|nr:MAG: 2-isopropylmalate synthase [Rhodobiaceae bacterium]
MTHADPKKAPMNFHRYRSYEPVRLTDRTWPDKVVTQAPAWCSVDLRDGNQALIDPMSVEEKKRLFQTLCEIGFKEIEVGFPAASETDFDFVRALIENQMIPDDVTIQVLTQARAELIEETFRSLQGCRRAIVHLYNSTSELQRRVVFEQDKAGIKKIATDAAALVRKLADAQTDTQWVFQYSPESFTGTEMDYAVEVCDAVMDIWEPTPDRKLIVNLPATVEMATPNIYADQIEWFGRTVKHRDALILSLHTHNDRGTGVAASEMGVMAGADRVEGTLFGNGERTGNVCIVTLALNLMSQGVDPELDFSDIDRIATIAKEITKLPIHPRHPYVGELVYTAFSGSHQDAIKKGFAALQKRNDDFWEVPYLPIDPKDVGRDYEAIIRINSQSGKGGVAHILAERHGLDLPRAMQVAFSNIVQAETTETGKEVDADTVWDLFLTTYINTEGPLRFVGCKVTSGATTCRIEADVTIDGKATHFTGTGTGPIDAYLAGLETAAGLSATVCSFHEHAVATGSGAEAAAYVEVEGTSSGASGYGCAIDVNTVTASLKAVTSAVNRMLADNRKT